MSFKIIKKPAAQQESIPGGLFRNASRLATRSVETALGLPGDVESLGRGALNLGGRLVAGTNVVSPESFLPTSERVREFGKKLDEPRLAAKGLSPNYLEPQGGLENFADEVTKTATGLLLPISGGTVGLTTKALRAAGIAGASELAKLGTQYVTGSEAAGEGAKIGTMLATSLIGTPGIKKYMDSLYATSESLIPEGAQATSKLIEPTLMKLEKVLSKGTTTPTKASVSRVVSDLRGKITPQNTLPITDVIEFKRNINELFGPKDLSGLTKFMPKLGHEIKSTIQEYGKSNPEFIKAFNAAEDIFQGLNAVTGPTAFLKRHATSANINAALTIAVLGLKDPVMVVKGVAVAATAKELLGGLEALARSPEIRRYYTSVLSAAAKENAPALIKNIEKLDRSIEKEFPSKQERGRYRLVKK